MPHFYVRILIYWWKQQYFSVKWENALSFKYKTEKGVRQGGILSPYLFNVYMDELGKKLWELKIGCRIGKVMSNNFWNADDICLLAPSIRAVQKMINICFDYAKEPNITFNPSKTVCQIFKSKNCTTSVGNVYMDSNKLNWVTQFNYLGYIF